MKVQENPRKTPYRGWAFFQRV